MKWYERGRRGHSGGRLLTIGSKVGVVGEKGLEENRTNDISIVQT
jgi:hypothetical protein